MTAPDTSAASVAAMIERLTPDWAVDEPIGATRRYLTRIGQTDMAAFLADATVENNSLKSDAASMLSELMRERDASEQWARKLTKGLVGLTVSGSEFFVRDGEYYYADIDKCVAYVRDRHERIHRQLVEAVIARKDAEAALVECATRFEKCMIHSGSDPEFAAEAVKSYRALSNPNQETK